MCTSTGCRVNKGKTGERGKEGKKGGEPGRLARDSAVTGTERWLQVIWKNMKSILKKLSNCKQTALQEVSKVFKEAQEAS